MRFWVDLADYSFSEEDTKRWIHALPIGKYKHPVYGEISIDRTKVQEFADNISQNVRGIDLDIDYDHKIKTTEASGWVRGAKVEDNGLWLLVEWTKDAVDKIKNKAYRYFSPEFKEQWIDAQGKTHRNVLFGGALTNRPFLKDLLPINFNEIVEDNPQEHKMDDETRKRLAQVLGLKEDASEDEVKTALSNYNPPAAVDLSKATVTKQEDGTYKVSAEGATGEVVVTPEKEEQPVAASEDHLKKLAETDPAVAIMLQERDENRRRLQDLEHANRLSEADAKLNGLESMPPVVRDKLRPILASAPRKLSEEIYDAVKKFDEVGPVPKGQLSNGQPPVEPPAGESVTEKVLTKLDEYMGANKDLTYADAIRKLSEQEPELYKQYNEETSFAGVEENE